VILRLNCKCGTDAFKASIDSETRSTNLICMKCGTIHDVSSVLNPKVKKLRGDIDGTIQHKTDSAAS
jgi:uncharacterized Zn finger protein